jgi:hypothetical protein
VFRRRTLPAVEAIVKVFENAEDEKEKGCRGKLSCDRKNEGGEEVLMVLSSGEEADAKLGVGPPSAPGDSRRGSVGCRHPARLLT